MNGNKFRYYWNEINKEVHFLGNKIDVYGYKFMGGEDANSRVILNESKKALKSDVVIIWTGRNEGNIANEESVQNITQTIENIRRKNKKTKIVLVFPAPSPIEKYDNPIDSLVKKLRQSKWQNVVTVDINKYIKQQKNWETTMFYKDYALTDDAYLQIVKLINEAVFNSK